MLSSVLSHFTTKAPRSVSRVMVLAMLLVCTLRAEMPFNLANWQTQDGLPSNKVMAVLQTKDGYLWAGTDEGLVRFDGVRFTHVENSRLDTRMDTSVTAICEAPDGTLWIGHDSGSISSYREGKFTVFNTEDAHQGVRVKSIAIDAANDVWAMKTDGLLMRLRDGLKLYPESGASRGVFELIRSADGALWISCRGKLSELRGEQLKVVPLLPDMNEWLQGIAPASDGGVWAVAGQQLWKYRAGQWSQPYGRVATGARIYHLRELRDGRLFAGTFEQGGFIITPTAFSEQRLWRETNFPSDWIHSACEDHEGSLWIATGSAGIFRLRDEKLRMLVPDDKWQGRSVLAVLHTSAGEIWASTEGAGIYRYLDGAWKAFSTESGIDNPYVWTMCEDAEGRLLLGTWGRGVYQKVGDRFVHPPGLEKLELGIAALMPSRTGGVLIGTRLGAVRYRNNAIEWLESDEDKKLKDVRHFLEEPDGTIWLACNGDGLGRIKDGKVRQYLRGDGLSSNYVRCLYQAPDGALWIGTRGGGLNRLKDDRFATVTSANGLVDDVISSIQDDGRGNLWIGSHGGIMRVSLADLNACADGIISRVTALSYGLNDGLLSLAASGPLQSSGCRLPTGELLFATGRGLVRIDPTNVQINPQPPPVEIESVKVGDKPAFEGAAIPETLEVGPGDHRIEIRYTALSFVAPEKVHFRRRLAGLEPDFVNAGSERVAVYSFVPPGEYVFHVTAANNDNIWNPGDRRLRIVFHPYFWQTTWFRIMVIVVLVGVGVGLTWYISRRRMHLKLEKLQRARAIELERTRIANDMHDDLGAHLTRITMLSDAARTELNEPERLGKGLDQIYETARSVTRAMDEIVWAVNPKHDTLESLVCYFEKFAQDFLGSAGMRLRLDLPVDYTDWAPSSEVRHNMFLCFKEALNNAVRHSGADTVTVTMTVRETECVVTVSDNGRGLGAPAHGATERGQLGNGLTSMRRRMLEIGGRCEITEIQGGGCSVTLVIPVARSGITVIERA